MNGTSLAKLRQPVDAVDERGDLRVGAELGELLVAAVHVADDRVGRDDLLAVEADDEAQRAVGGRVLRADVEDHVVGVELDVDLRVGQVAERGAGRCRTRAVGGSVVLTSAVVRRRRVGVGVVVVAFAGHRLDVDEARPRLHLAGEQREVLAQRVPLELGRAGRGGAGSGGRRSTMPNISHASRSCQSAPA